MYDANSLYIRSGGEICPSRVAAGLACGRADPGGALPGYSRRGGGVNGAAPGKGKTLRGGLRALLVFAATVALVMLLASFVFRPLLADEVNVGTGQADSIQRAKFWGEGPIVGHTFTPRDPTRAMSPEDLGFDFRVPGTWGCMKAAPDDPGEARWICVDEDWDGPDAAIPSGTVVVRPCPRRACNLEQARSETDKREAGGEFEAPVKRPDSRTEYIQWTEERGSGSRYFLSMRHFWHRSDGGRLDAEVIVLFSAPSDLETDVQKIVNDVREATP